MPSRVPSDFATTHFLTEGDPSLDLMNSEHSDYRGRRPLQDVLEDEVWLAAGTHYWRLPVTPPPDALALEALRALRALLHRIPVCLATHQPLSDEQLEELNTFLALAPVHQQLLRVPDGVRRVASPTPGGLDGNRHTGSRRIRRPDQQNTR